MTLTDDLRAAFRERAQEIPDGVGPALPLRAPSRRRRRAWPALAAGSIAAALVAIALVGGERPTTEVRPTDSTTSTTLIVTPPEEHTATAGTFAGLEATEEAPVVWRVIVAGSLLERHPYQLITARQGDRRRVALVADGIEGRFVLEPGPVPADPPAFLQIGPCCRLGGYTLVVGAVAPDVAGASILHDGGDVVRGAFAGVADPADPGGWRYLLLPVEPGVTTATLRLSDAEGTPIGEPVELDLTTIGG